MSKKYLSITSEDFAVSIPIDKIIYSSVAYIKNDDRFSLLFHVSEVGKLHYYTNYGALESETIAETCSRLSMATSINLDFWF